MIRRASIVAAILVACVAVRSTFAQEPDSRAELLRMEREEKARSTAPPEPGRIERVLQALENRRTFERLLNPAEGVYPKIGNVTPGSGFGGGPAYRRTGFISDAIDLSTFGMVSTKQYWHLEARVTAPRLASERALVDVHVQRFEYPEEDFFGLGPDSRREDFVTYRLRSTVVGATAAYRPVPWFSVTGGANRLTPEVSASREPGGLRSLFGESDAPGLSVQPTFARYEAAADLNYRQPRGNPRRGGKYTLRYQRYQDLDDTGSSFDRVEADVQQYISILKERRVIALHAMASLSDSATSGGRVPFYYQRTLGGPDDLRGFRRFRFRDENVLLLQAEYRWEIFTAMDGAIFYDAGKVASRIEDVNLKDLESDYGIGFRFGTANGVFLRVEGAFGSRGGKHFILRFGHVF